MISYHSMPYLQGTLTVFRSSRGIRFISLSDNPIAEYEAWFGTQDELVAGAPLTDVWFNGAVDVVGTAFQQAVWQALRTIPTGEVRTYAQVAAMIGRPTAVRAVATAIGKNPLLVIVPCHRVIRSDGSLGAFRAGEAWKRRLLESERVER